ncbi:sensor domain-containing diguanylate cyclase [Leifsonia sp. A12D58]|uniref:sensor domain-containing diguanylate cyclase n=1 Tax=Leifsonia sp. A12D58 TaxID=3397674 RepID=UPI0039E11A8F
MESVLAQLSHTVTAADSFEELTRPMLEMLAAVTGLESTYLTTIDRSADNQHVLFARNVGGIQVTEGLDVPFSQSVCKRALDEEVVYASDVATRWADNELAAQIGIQTYFSVPITTVSGGLYGTLCGISGTPVAEKPNAESVLRLFAQLLAQNIERELMYAQLQGMNAELESHASTDALTGLPNRRTLIDALRRMLATGERDDRGVLVGFIDLDGFKVINDEHGHDIGDEFLVAMARQLGRELREGDMLARIGGDEFIVIGWGPVTTASAVSADSAGARSADADASTSALAARLGERTIGRFELSNHLIDYAGASVGVVSIAPGSATAEEALRQADARMYAVKRERKALHASMGL